MPPMDLPTLLAESTVERAVTEATTELIAVKARTRELGTGTPPEVLVRFVDAELDLARPFDDLPPENTSVEAHTRADAYFLGELDRLR